MIFCSGLLCSVYLVHGNEVGSPRYRFDGFDVLLIQITTTAVSLDNFKLALHALSLIALG